MSSRSSDRLRILLCMSATVFLYACTSATESRDRRAFLPIQKYTNSDIRFDGTYFGLIVKTPADFSDAVESLDSGDTAALISLLDDPDRFVVAHVSLAFVHNLGILGAVAEWHGLGLDITPQNQVIYDLDAMTKVKQFWNERL